MKFPPYFISARTIQHPGDLDLATAEACSLHCNLQWQAVVSAGSQCSWLPPTGLVIPCLLSNHRLVASQQLAQILKGVLVKGRGWCEIPIPVHPRTIPGMPPCLRQQLRRDARDHVSDSCLAGAAWYPFGPSALQKLLSPVCMPGEVNIIGE